MRVLHISSPKTWRGGEQQLIYLAEELKLLGVEQVVMCPFNSEVHKYCLKNHLAHVTYFKGFSANPMVAFRVAHVCSKERIHLIHVHDSHAHNFAILSAVLTKNERPIVVSRRVDFAIQGSSMSLFKYNHPNIKKVVCVSAAIRDVMLEFIEDKSKLKVVHSGIDLSRFENVVSKGTLRTEYQIPDDYSIIGNVSALAPHKDYQTFVDTAKRLIDEGFKAKFIAIGEGPSRKEIEEYIDQNKMQEHVILTGFRTDVPELLKELDIFLITSKTEGLGTSIIDALASNAPVVAAKAGGIVEVIEHEVCGLLCDIQNPDQLASAVKRMLADGELRKKCIAGGKEKVKQFSKSETARKSLQIYQEVLSDFSDNA
jgi:L-malate glycosyltransferase